MPQPSEEAIILDGTNWGRRQPKKRLLRRCDTAPKNKITSVEFSGNGSKRNEEKKLQEKKDVT